MRPAPIQILLVEDNPAFARLIRENLADAGGAQFQVAHADSLAGAIQGLAQGHVDVVLLDLSLPDSFGLETVARVRAVAPHAPLIVLTGSDDERMAVESVRQGAQDYLVKGQTHERLLLRSIYYAIERKRAEEELEARVRDRTAQLAEANQALQAEIAEHRRLQNEILQISEREQRRIGRDLHDGLGQSLTGIIYVMDALEQKLRRQALPEAEDAEKAIKLLDQAMVQARALARGLSPVRLDAEGLMNALWDFANTVNAQWGIPCSFDCKPRVLVHDTSAATHLYRIGQEAVNNAVKHGKPTRIGIRLSEADGRITLTVQDNGIGIPDTQGKREGLGLHTMRYRAGLLGGTVDIRRAPGGGTLVTCCLPVPSRESVKA